MLLRTAVLLVAAATMAAAGDGPLRALLVTGWYDHGFLDAEPCLERILLESGRFDVRVADLSNGATEATLKPYDVLLVLYNGPRWGSVTEKAVEAFVSSGKGMVTIHGTTYAFGGVEVRKPRFKRSGIIEPPWQEFVRMIGCRWPEEKLGHGDRHQFPVRFVDREHPIMRGLGEILMADDELYHRITVLPQANILATAFDDPKIRGTGKDEPIMWTVNYGQGRVFHTTLGHDAKAMRAPAFRETITRAAEWAGTGTVAVRAANAHE